MLAGRSLALSLSIAIAACEPPGYGKHVDADAPAPPDGRAPADAALTADANASADAAPPADADAPAPDAAAPLDGSAPVTCEHTFRLDSHASSTSVWVSGDFVAWAPTPDAGAVALALGDDGVWSATRTFAAGTYQYKLILDGATWIADPANPDQIDDGFGGRNSVLRCP